MNVISLLFIIIYLVHCSIIQFSFIFIYSRDVSAQFGNMFGRHLQKWEIYLNSIWCSRLAQALCLLGYHVHWETVANETPMGSPIINQWMLTCQDWLSHVDSSVTACTARNFVLWIISDHSQTVISKIVTACSLKLLHLNRTVWINHTSQSQKLHRGCIFFGRDTIQQNTLLTMMLTNSGTSKSCSFVIGVAIKFGSKVIPKLTFI